MAVSWSTRNIQLILFFLECQMNFPRHFYVLSIDIYIKGKKVKYVPKLFERSRYTPLKVWFIYTLASNFWSTYALMGVSWSTRNIQLILLFFICQIDFPHHLYILSFDIYIKRERGHLCPNYPTQF